MYAEEVTAQAIEDCAADNVNWVGGDPTPNIHYILKTVSLLDRNIPQIFNSNMYLTEDSMQLLDGVVDLYLTDFKFGNDGCAQRLCRVENYWEVITRNHLLAKDQADIIVRHLVMPSHFDCCTKPILDWISENLGEGALVNVMAQYRPEYKAFAFDEISQSLAGSEYKQAIGYAKELGLRLSD